MSMCGRSMAELEQVCNGFDADVCCRRACMAWRCRSGRRPIRMTAARAASVSASITGSMRTAGCVGSRWQCWSRWVLRLPPVASHWIACVVCRAVSQEWAVAKPYKCSNCEKRFGEQRGLDAHSSTCGMSMAVDEQVRNGVDVWQRRVCMTRRRRSGRRPNPLSAARAASSSMSIMASARAVGAAAGAPRGSRARSSTSGSLAVSRRRPRHNRITATPQQHLNDIS